MAILRAGPWGNLSDSFQNVPSDVTADELTLYPVNCAKTDWLGGQAWGAYYEVTESGCCTPASLDFDFQDGFGNNLSGTLERDLTPIYGSLDLCEAYTWTDGTYTAYLYWSNTGYGTYPCSPSNPDYPAGWAFDILDVSSYAILYGVNENATDRCDPVSTYYEIFSCPRDTGWRAIVTLPTP